jgi:hypothetical protein
VPWLAGGRSTYPPNKERNEKLSLESLHQRKANADLERGTSNSGQAEYGRGTRMPKETTTLARIRIFPNPKEFVPLLISLSFYAFGFPIYQS